MRFWDVASGTQVRQVAGWSFALTEGPPNEDKTKRYVLTTSGEWRDGDFKKEELLLITALPASGGEQQDAAAPVACFKAPHPIVAVRRHGATICVGCDGGEVLFLRAPFLAA